MIYINGEKLVTEQFPNGETKFITKFVTEMPYRTDAYIITLKYENDTDLFNLMMIKYQLAYCNPNAKTGLVVPYFPYERMDRVQDLSHIFTLKHMAKMINNLNFSYVEIWEPHSDVISALLDRVVIRNVTKEFYTGCKKPLTLSFAPDAGAQKRYQCDLVGIKHRNFETGLIESYYISGDTEKIKKADKIYILDDLCSYGGTFLLAGKEIKKINPDIEINLIVAHCEKSILKGEIVTSDTINKIYTTDSIISYEDIDNAGLNNKIIIRNYQ